MFITIKNYEEYYFMPLSVLLLQKFNSNQKYFLLVVMKCSHFTQRQKFTNLYTLQRISFKKKISTTRI